MESYMMFIDRVIAYDICFCPYDGHRQTRPLDNIAFYSWWLTCGSHMIYPHLPERVMHQFKFLHIIQRPPYVSVPLCVSASPTDCHRDLDVILDNFFSHLVPYEAHNVPTPGPWVAIKGSSFISIRYHILTWHQMSRKHLLDQFIRRY